MLSNSAPSKERSWLRPRNDADSPSRVGWISRQSSVGKPEPSSKRTVPWRIAQGLVYCAAVLGVWQVLYLLTHPPAYLMPSVPEVYDFLVQDHQLVIQSCEQTLTEFVTGYLIALGGGVILAALFEFIPIIRRILWPLVMFIQLAPKVAFAPWFLIIFGFGIESKILLAVIGAFFAVLLNSIAGLESLPADMAELARSMRMTKLQFYLRIKLRWALPQTFAGAKIAVTQAVIGATIGEFLASNSGLGHLVILGQGELNSTVIVSSIILLTILGRLVYGVVSLVEKLVIPWHVSQRKM